MHKERKMKSKLDTSFSRPVLLTIIMMTLFLTNCGEPTLVPDMRIRVEKKIIITDGVFSKEVDQYPSANEQFKVIAEVTYNPKLNINNPTGYVKLTSSEGNACHEMLIGSKVSCKFSFSTPGEKTIKAVYYGDSDFVETTASKTIEVYYNPRVYIIGTNPDPVLVGDSIEILILVEGDGPTPTGSVEVTGFDPDWGVIITVDNPDFGDCIDTLSAEGTTSCTIPVTYPSPGSRNLKATYSGDENYVWEQIHYTLEVEPPFAPSTTTTIVKTLPAAPLVNDWVTVVVTVTHPDGSIAHGIVTITGADTTCSIETSYFREDRCSVQFNSKGTKTLVATFNPHPNPLGVETSKDTYVIEVTKPEFDPTTTTTIVQTIPSSPLVNDWVTVVVEVTHPDGSTPDGKVVIGGADTICTIDLTNGEDRCSVQFNSKGLKTLDARFVPDPSSAVETSLDTFVVEVTKPEPTATPLD